jgi:hypothetical protein
MTENDDLVLSHDLVLGAQGATDLRRHTEEREEIGRDPRPLDPVGGAFAGQRHGIGMPGGHPPERSVHAPPVHVVGR